MYKISLLTALALLLLVGPAAAAADGDGIIPYPTHVEKLDNGLTVVLVPMSSGGLVSYWTIVRTGSRDEFEPGHTGFAHFFEHMMFRGTEKFPADVYNAETTALGADANAFTTDDLTAYYLVVAAADLARVVELEADRFQNLSYAEPAFRTEAGSVYGEYRKGRTSPFFTLYEKVLETAYDEHTYGHTTMGYEADIKAMPTLYEYSLSFFDRYYRPENTVVFISGDIEVEPTLELIRKHYGAWEAGYVSPEVPAEPEQGEERRVEVSYEGRSLPILWLAYKAGRFDPDDKGMAALALLGDLAFGETSDLYKKLVLEEQMVEFVQADSPVTRDPGLMDIISMVKDEANLDKVLAEIDATIARYQASPPDAERLEDLKSRLKYGFLMGLDTPGHVSQALSRLIAVSGGLEAVDRLYATYQAVTPEDVQAAAQEYLVKNRRTIGILRGAS